MLRIQLQYKQVGPTKLASMLSNWAAQEGASISKGTLRTMPGSHHWHISGRQRVSGTVEVTLYPEMRQLLVLVHGNRRGTWAGEACHRLARFIEERIAR